MKLNNIHVTFYQPRYDQTSYKHFSHPEEIPFWALYRKVDRQTISIGRFSYSDLVEFSKVNEGNYIAYQRKSTNAARRLSTFQTDSYLRQSPKLMKKYKIYIKHYKYDDLQWNFYIITGKIADVLAYCQAVGKPEDELQLRRKYELQN